MPDVPMSTVIQQLRRVVARQDGASLTDGQLLSHFLDHRDEVAFAMLVRRHGPMVLGVCLRVLGNRQDAEDAFQATFLVLVRKGAALASRELLANWLYGVACNTALKAKAVAVRRRLREKQVMEMPEAALPQQEPWSDEPQTLLDQELSRLPDKYRVPIVLCDLQEKTRKEAAKQLGVPEGTIASRLGRARALLAKRLARRGVLLSGEALAGILSVNAVSACVPPSLVVATAKAASLFAAGQTAAAGLISANVVILTEGVLKTMFLTKLKLATAVLLTVGFVCGAGVFMHSALADKPAAQPSKEKASAQSKENATELTAVVQSVDAAKNTLTVIGKPFGTRTFDVIKEARVILDDGTGGKLGFKDGKLTDVAEGFVVTLRVSEDGNSVTGIWAEGPTIQGDVKVVSAEKRTITVTVPDKKNQSVQEKTFEVAKNATVVIHDGKPKDKLAPPAAAKLADVPAGAVVTLKLSADQKVVGSIQAEGPEVHGFLKAVDGGKSTITVSVSDGKQTVEKTFDVLPTASLAISDGKGKGKQPGQALKLTDLPVGAQVMLKLTLDRKGVLSIATQEIKLSGVVKAVDAGKSNLTLLVGGSKTEPAEEKTFDVARDAAVWIDDKLGKLADLPTDSLATVKLHADRKTVGSIQAEGPGISGTVKAVDAGQSTITLVAGKGGEERTLAVRKDAPVFIDGKAGKLADVPVDAQAGGKLTADQKACVSLKVDGPTLQGVLKGVDAGKGKITVSVRVNKTESEDKVYDLAKDVVVVMTAGKTSTPLKVGDLKTDKQVILQITADQKTVVGIRVLGDQ